MVSLDKSALLNIQKMTTFEQRIFPYRLHANEESGKC